MGRRKSSDWITGGGELTKINKRIEYKLKRSCNSCGEYQKTLPKLRKHERTVCKVEVKPKLALPNKVKQAKNALSKKAALKSNIKA